MKLILFGTSACHLCEQAEEILTIILPRFPQLILEKIDIAEQTEWQELYAVKIPVVYHAESKREIGWPFNENDVTTFIYELTND